jgi:hypothetical protein
VLEASGLVRSQKIGRTRTCSFNPPTLRSAETWITERRSLWERRLDRLGDYLTDAATTGSSPDELHDSPTHQPDQPKETQ